MGNPSRWSIALLFIAAVVIVGCGKQGGGEPPTESPDAGGGGCGLQTCESQKATCGPVGDGCGGVIDCGSCTGPESCGGGGTLFTCGSSADVSCNPRTCAAAGATCGAVSDGCGGMTADCGDCPTGETCGGGGTANKCGAPPCTGL